MNRNPQLGALLLSLLLAAALAGCGSHETVQVPVGMKVGPPLTQAQVQAIQQKRATQQGN